MEEVLNQILATLQDINSKLDSLSICPHGTTGVCMFCIQPTLDSIEMAVRSK